MNNFYNSRTVTDIAKQALDEGDGNEVTRQQILAEIDRQIGLHRVTDGMVARGISDVLKDAEYMKVGYGIYKKVTDKKEKEKQPYTNLISNTNKIVKETLVKLEKEINNYENNTKSNLNYSSANIIEEIKTITDNLKYTKKFSDFIKENIDLDIN